MQVPFDITSLCDLKWWSSWLWALCMETKFGSQMWKNETTIGSVYM